MKPDFIALDTDSMRREQVGMDPRPVSLYFGIIIANIDDDAQRCPDGSLFLIITGLLLTPSAVRLLR